ncbi:hypothetical protein B0H10DRAFT_1808124 [Mycena sp. CBHHK59/15]|nr:hypothetical protein B0H10DRAFT_1808124 [Mycena sp. CBHHK59/15]
MAHILRTRLADAVVSGIQGNAERKVKEMAVKWLNIFHAHPDCFAGSSSRRINVTEVSVNPSTLEDALVGTVVCEIDVTEDILDGQDELSNAFIVLLIDECATAAVTALNYAEGGLGIAGVSQSLNTVFHNSSSLQVAGARLRIINTTLSAGSSSMSCRSEVWDLTRRRLIASGVFVGMQSSQPKGLVRL